MELKGRSPTGTQTGVSQDARSTAGWTPFLTTMGPPPRSRPRQLRQPPPRKTNKPRTPMHLHPRHRILNRQRPRARRSLIPSQRLSCLSSPSVAHFLRRCQFRSCRFRFQRPLLHPSPRTSALSHNLFRKPREPMTARRQQRLVWACLISIPLVQTSRLCNCQLSRGQPHRKSRNESNPPSSPNLCNRRFQ